MPLSLALAGTQGFERWRALRKNRIAAYSAALLLVGLATLLRLAIGDRIVPGLPFITYYPTVVLATLLGGFGPGIAAVLISSVVADLLFIPPAFALLAGAAEISSVLVFLLLSMMMIGVVGLLDLAVVRLLAHEQNIRTLIDAAPNGIVVVDGSGNITLVNPRAEALFGFARDEMLGRPIETLLPTRLATGHTEVRETYMKDPQVRAMGVGRDLSARRKDGSEFPVEIGLSPVARDGSTGVLATVVDITERRQIQERERLFVAELKHRVQNLLAVVDAIARRSFTETKSLAEARADFSGRLKALAQAHASLTESDWHGASLRRIIATECSAFSKRVEVNGCEIMLNGTAARQFALIVHELATNAMKHGAFAVPEGRVVITGEIPRDAQDRFRFTWTELDGRPVRQPERKGFGSVILSEAAKQFGQSVTLMFEPGGLVYSLEVLREAAEEPSAGQQSSVA
jgi:PAS domain S-box-containing protein